MATTRSSSRTKKDELRHEILSYKRGKAVIGVIDVFRDARYIVPAMRSALREDVKASELEDQTGYLTESVSLIIKHGTVTPSELEEYLQDTAGNVRCTLMIVNPKRVSYETGYIMTIKKITGHFPRCAMLNIGGSEIIEQARNILKEHGITDIYEVPKPDHNLSDEEQMQCLGLLHGCLEEGDKTSTTDDQKKICSNPKYGSTGPELPQEVEAAQGPPGGQTLSQEPKEIIDHPLLDDKSSKPQGDVASGGMDQHSEEVSHQITADLDGTSEDLSADGKKVHWEFLTESPKLTLQDDEVVISCGIRFSPSKAKLSKPIKVTLNHNARFNNPRHAEIIFYTRNKDSETFERIPAFTDGSYPCCDVRAKDLDLYVDHFSIWWIVAKVNQYFFGKRVKCTPYVRSPVRKGSTHFVLLRIYDDLSEVIEKMDKEMTGYKQLHPPQPMIVEQNRCDINIELFEGLNENEKKIGEEKKSSKEIIRFDRTSISFAVRQLESGVGQKFLKFTLDQEKSSCKPTLIKFELQYDDVTTTTAAGAELGTTPAHSQAARVSTSAPSGQTTREEGNQVKPDDEGFYTQLMQTADPSPDQLDPEKNYKMDALTKGHMFILNMSEDRQGSDVDVKNIKHVFGEIGYEIDAHSNLTAKELQDKLGEFVDSSRHEGMCSAVFLFMAHGNITDIECTDGTVSIEFIMEKVYGMKSMNGRPKMFFFQCCRGKADENKVKTDQAERDIAIPIKSDVLVAYATTPGDFAYRQVRGSWFIQMLCEKLLENAHVSDLATIVEQVSGKVWDIATIKEREQHPVLVKQMISKKIYFLPKYQRIADNE